jgi:hypothetical protein
MLPHLDENLLRYSDASVWVALTSLKRGYGYALDADGSAAPSLSAAALKEAIDGSKRPQINVNDLRRALETRK